VQAFPAEDAGAVGVQEGRDDDIANFGRTDVGASGVDDANERVSHATTSIAGLHRLVRLEVTTANGGPGDPHDGVGRLDQASVTDRLDSDVAGAAHDSYPHCRLPPISGVPPLKVKCGHTGNQKVK
jgi:hypothetical protein